MEVYSDKHTEIQYPTAQNHKIKEWLEKKMPAKQISTNFWQQNVFFKKKYKIHMWKQNTLWTMLILP